MTRSRFFLLALGILLFSVAAAGLYLRQNLPWILQLQAQQFLQQYGVEEFEFEGLHVADGIVRVDTLVLHGNVDTLAYRATLTGGEMHYNWRMLFQGKLQTLNLENLDIAIEQTITSDSEPLASIRLDEWLPLHWISQLPVQSLRVQHLALAYQSPGVPDFSARGSLSVDEQLMLLLETELAGGEVTANVQAGATPPALEMTLALREGHANIAELSAGLRQDTDDEWLWELQGQAEHATLLAWLRRFETSYHLPLGLPALEALSLGGKSALSAQIWQPGVLHFGDSGASFEVLLPQLKVKAHLASEIQQLVLSNGIGSIDGTLEADATLLGGEQVQATTRLKASLNARVRKQRLPQVEIAFTQSGNIEHSEFTLRLADTAESIHADVTGTVNLSSGQGEYHLGAQTRDLPYFSSITLPLLRHFDLLPGALAIRSGSVRLDTRARSRDFDFRNWEQTSQLSVKNVSGDFDDYAFEGLALSADWSGIDQWKSRKALDITLAKLNLGFELRDIHLRVNLPKSTPISSPKVHLQVFSTGMFGGQLLLPHGQDWDFAAPENQLTLRAQGWQLAELVALQKNAAIQASGTLEGELPVTVADGRIIIDNGYLRALPPGGSIRYLATEENRALADNSSELALALDLLSDFQYQVLSSQVQLDKQGNLLLGLLLEGSNPAQFDGQAINFNINVEQNVDPLLQSLRLSDNLAKKIEGGLK